MNERSSGARPPAGRAVRGVRLQADRLKQEVYEQVVPRLNAEDCEPTIFDALSDEMRALVRAARQ